MTVSYQNVIGGFFEFNWLAAGSTQLALFDAADSFTEIEVTSGSALTNNQGQMAWSYDDDYICMTHFGSAPYATLFSVEVDAATRVPTVTELTASLPTFVAGANAPAWAPDSNLLVVGKTTGTAPYLRAYQETATNVFTEMTTPFDVQPTHDVTSCAFNPANPTMFVSGTNDSPTLELYSRDLADDTFTRTTATNIDTNIPTTGRFVSGLAFSPDGNWLVAAVTSTVPDLYVYLYSVSGDSLVYDSIIINDTSEDSARGAVVLWTPDSEFVYILNADAGAVQDTWCFKNDSGAFNAVAITNGTGTTASYGTIDGTGTYLVTSDFSGSGATAYNIHTITPSTGQLSTATTLSSANISEVGGIAFSNNPPGS